MKRQSGSEVEGWSGDPVSGWRRRDAEINVGQRRVDQREREERILKSHLEPQLMFSHKIV